MLKFLGNNRHELSNFHQYQDRNISLKFSTKKLEVLYVKDIH